MKRKTNKPRRLGRRPPTPLTGPRALRDKMSRSPSSATKSQQEQAAAVQAPHGKAGRKAGTGPGKAGKAEAAEKARPRQAAGRAALGGVHGFVHGKIYEVEQENVGTEGAHRSELVGESVLRHGTAHVHRLSGSTRPRPSKEPSPSTSRLRRTIITAPHRSTRSWTRAPFPGTGKSGGSKSSIRKQAREAAKQRAKAAEKTAVTTEKLAARAVAFVKRHPVGVVRWPACC